MIRNVQYNQRRRLGQSTSVCPPGLIANGDVCVPVIYSPQGINPNAPGQLQVLAAGTSYNPASDPTQPLRNTFVIGVRTNITF